MGLWCETILLSGTRCVNIGAIDNCQFRLFSNYGRVIDAKEIWPFGAICVIGVETIKAIKLLILIICEATAVGQDNDVEVEPEWANYRRHGQENTQMEQTRLLESILVSLKHEKSRHDSFDEPDHTYEIKTQIEINEREWCFNSVATYNGIEITDDPELTKETICRKRVAQINKTKALWNLFVKEAATIHFDRCKAVRHRLERSHKRPLTVNSKTAMALMILVLICFVISMFYFTRSPSQSPVLRSDMVETPPSVTPVAFILEEPEPVPPFEVKDRVSEDIETSPSPATTPRAADEIDPADPPEKSAGLTDDVSSTSRSIAIDRKPEPSQEQAPDPQIVRNLSPEEIKAQVRSILEHKTESP